MSTLEEYLGDAAKIIDLLVDQSPEGLEVLRGSSTYTYDGNWKVQAENGADGYHVTATHWNYAATTARRASGESSEHHEDGRRRQVGQAGRGLLVVPERPHGAVDLGGQLRVPAALPEARRAQEGVR